MITTVQQFFQEADESTLAEIAWFYPEQMKSLCALLSIELQQELEAAQPKTKKLKKKKKK